MDPIDEIDQRISRLRSLLSAEATVPTAQEADALDLFEGHEPAHAAPGPLLDKLSSPGAPTAERAEHRPLHADVS